MLYPIPATASRHRAGLPGGEGDAMKLRKRTWKTAEGEKRQRWFMDATDPLTGERVRETIPDSIRTEAEARDFASAWHADRVRRAKLGELAGPSIEERCLTLGALLEADANRAGISPATARGERQSHRVLFRAIVPATRVLELKGVHVERYKRQMEGEGLKPRSIAYPLQVLRAALNRAVANGILSRVPCRVTLPPQTAERKRALTREEALALAGAARELGIGDEVTVFLNLGLRRGELFNLRWADLNLEEAELRMVTHKRGAASMKAVDVLPLNEAVLEVFRRRADAFPKGKPPAKGYVFGIPPEERDTGRRRSAHIKGAVGHLAGVVSLEDYRFRTKLKAAATRAGIERPEEVTPHVLRHTFATCLLNAGCTVKDTQALLRHRTPDLTLRLYCHEGMPGMKRGVEALTIRPAEVVAIGGSDAEAWHKSGTKRDDEEAQTQESQRLTGTA